MAIAPRLLLICLAGGFLSITTRCDLGRSASSDENAPEVTFASDIAPLIYENCATCHHPEGAAPFSLTSLEHVSRRAAQIYDVISDRYMPPYLPDPAAVHFENERYLTDEQIGMFGEWVAAGKPAGDLATAPSPPTFDSGWQLGEPDLVVSMPEPYVVPAEGSNIFRHMVVPIPLETRRYFRGFEFRTNNPKVVHHARFLFDRSGEARRNDALDPDPGYQSGMAGSGLESPEGQWLGWTPGKLPTLRDERFAWSLDPGTDLVMEMHLTPSGKPEPVQCEFAFYFSSKPPKFLPVIVRLGSKTMDIPAGETEYEMRDAITLPVDVRVLNVYPHAHLLAQRMESWAILPDGSKKWLLRIPQWNFDWQDEYRYSEPLFLPRGTEIRMRYIYDNSADNPRNPNIPPRRVTYGPETEDEMGDLWFQVITRTAADRDVLGSILNQRELDSIVDEKRFRLRITPEDTDEMNALATAHMMRNEPEEAKRWLLKARALAPEDGKTLNNLGGYYMRARQFDHAQELFETGLRHHPERLELLKNLAKVHGAKNQFAESERFFERSLALNDHDAESHFLMTRVKLALEKRSEALAHIQRCLQLAPQNQQAQLVLQQLQSAPAP